MAIAKGLLSEDDYLLQEILFNPRTPGQVANIRTEPEESSRNHRKERCGRYESLPHQDSGKDQVNHPLLR